MWIACLGTLKASAELQSLELGTESRESEKDEVGTPQLWIKLLGKTVLYVKGTVAFWRSERKNEIDDGFMRIRVKMCRGNVDECLSPVFFVVVVF